MEISYKYRAYPDREIEAKAIASIDAARFVYNHMLERLNNAPKDKKPGVYDLMRELTMLKKEHTFLTVPYSHMLQRVVQNLFSNAHALHGAKNKGRRVGKLRFKLSRI